MEAKNKSRLVSRSNKS